jgi:TPR repeat protein
MKNLLKNVEEKKILLLMTVCILTFLYSSNFYHFGVLDGLGYHDNGEEIMGVPEESRDAKRRLQEAARQGDSNAAKKARRIAEASSGQRGSILKHLQTGISGTRVVSAKEVARKFLW